MPAQAFRAIYSPIRYHEDSSDGFVVTAVARHSGVLSYATPTGFRNEFVSPDLMLSRDDQDRIYLGQMGGAPATIEHPGGFIREDAEKIAQAKAGKVLEEIDIYDDKFDGDRKVLVRVRVDSGRAIDMIRRGELKGVSPGYGCDMRADSGQWKGKSYQFVQVPPFSFDHVALVRSPRGEKALFNKFDSEDVGYAVVDRGPYFDMNDPEDLIEVPLITGEVAKYPRSLAIQLMRSPLGMPPKISLKPPGGCGCGCGGTCGCGGEEEEEDDD